MSVDSLADVRPGDICFTNIRGLIPGVFPVKAGMLALGERFRVGTLSVDHVIVAVSAGLGVQAMPGGAEWVTLTPEDHWNERTAFVRLPETYPGQALDAARIAEEFVLADVPYSFGSYLMLAAWRYGLTWRDLERRIDRRLPARPVDLPGRGYRAHLRLPAEAVCSVLADQAWSLAGHRVVEGVAHQAVTPGRLAMSLWRRDGVIWGGPGVTTC